MIAKQHLETIRESLKYAKQRVVDAQHPTYQSKLDSLRKIESAMEYVKSHTAAKK